MNIPLFVLVSRSFPNHHQYVINGSFHKAFCESIVPTCRWKKLNFPFLTFSNSQHFQTYLERIYFNRIFLQRDCCETCNSLFHMCQFTLWPAVLSNFQQSISRVLKRGRQMFRGQEEYFHHLFPSLFFKSTTAEQNN